MKILSLVYECEEYSDSLRDYYKILKQGVYNPDRVVKFLDEAKEATFKLLDSGKLLHKVSVYEHEGCQFTYKKAKLIQF